MENIFTRAARFLREQRLGRRWRKIVGVLAALVVFCTTYALILPAMTAERQTICGMEAHEHTEECFENGVQICGKEAHTHTEECYAQGKGITVGVIVGPQGNSAADVPPEPADGELEIDLSGDGAAAPEEETQLTPEQQEQEAQAREAQRQEEQNQIAQRLAAVSLTGTWSDDVTEAAKAYAGCLEDGRGMIDEVLQFSGVEGIPQASDGAGGYTGYADWVSQIRAAGRYKDSSKIPKEGDIAFLDLDDNPDRLEYEDDRIDHAGIVISVRTEKKTIEATGEKVKTLKDIMVLTDNAEGRIESFFYSMENPSNINRIAGYAKLPKNPAQGEAEEPDEENMADETAPQGTEPENGAGQTEQQTEAMTEGQTGEQTGAQQNEAAAGDEPETAAGMTPDGTETEALTETENLTETSGEGTETGDSTGEPETEAGNVTETSGTETEGITEGSETGITNVTETSGTETEGITEGSETGTTNVTETFGTETEGLTEEPKTETDTEMSADGDTEAELQETEADTGELTDEAETESVTESITETSMTETEGITEEPETGTENVTEESETDTETFTEEPETAGDMEMSADEDTETGTDTEMSANEDVESGTGEPETNIDGWGWTQEDLEDEASTEDVIDDRGWIWTDFAIKDDTGTEDETDGENPAGEDSENETEWDEWDHLEDETETEAEGSNPEADLETDEDWAAATAGAELTGIWGDDLAAVAGTQLGVKESTENFILDESGEQKGITRYGQWYGEPYGDWDAMFVSFCLNYAEVPHSSVPRAGSCGALAGMLEAYGLYETPAGYEAAKGDLVFLDTDADGAADHVGILEEVTESGISVIAGDMEDEVKSTAYAKGDAAVLAYGRLPQRPAQKLHNKVFNDGKVQVTAEYTAEAGIPENAHLVATEIPQDDERYKEHYETVQEIIRKEKEEEETEGEEGIQTVSLEDAAEQETETETEEELYMRVYNIGFYMDETEYTPQAEVKISIEFLDDPGFAAGANKVIHMEEGKDPETLDVTNTEEEVSGQQLNKIEFSTKTF